MAAAAAGPFGGLTAAEWLEQNRRRRADLAFRRSDAAKKGWATRRARLAAFDPAVAAAQAEAAREDARELMARIEGRDGHRSLQVRLNEFARRGAAMKDKPGYDRAELLEACRTGRCHCEADEAAFAEAAEGGGEEQS